MIQIVAGAAAAGALVGSLLAAWAMGTYKDATWGASVNAVKAEAATLLANETDRVMKLERVSQARVRELEAQHVQEEKNLDVIQRRNRTLAAQLGGLRDPGRRAGGPNAMPGTPVAAKSLGDVTSTGYLSAEATAVLLDAAAEADALASYARTCYDYVQSVVSVKRDDS